MQEKSTQELLTALSQAENLNTFLEENKPYFRHDHLSDFLVRYMEQKGIRRRDLVQGSQLEEVYAYQILNGIKIPRRDKVLCLLLAMHATLEECQTLLKVCGYPPLYAKNERDAVLIYAFNNGLNVMETQERLDQEGIGLLD